MRGAILVLSFVFAGTGIAHAKPMPRAYGYGAVAAQPAPVLDLRGQLPPGPDAELSAPQLATAQPVAAVAPSLPNRADGALTASCYGPDREGGSTQSGEAYNPAALSAAHPDMPISSLAMLTNARTGKEVIVRVNDRPASGADMQITPAVANALGADSCQADVSIRLLGSATRVPQQKPAPQTFASAAEPPMAAAPAPAPSGAYLVQVGAYSQRENAEYARDKLQTAGPISIEPAVVGGMSYFRVRLGPWTTQQEAEQARAAAADLGFTGAKLLLP